MMGLIGKPKLCAKFKIASFSHCKNIKLLGVAQTSVTPTFVFRCDFYNWTWQTQALYQI